MKNIQHRKTTKSQYCCKVSNPWPWWWSAVEASSHLLLLLWDGRWIFPLRRADLRHEVRKLDLWWLPGSNNDVGGNVGDIDNNLKVDLRHQDAKEKDPNERIRLKTDTHVKVILILWHGFWAQTFVLLTKTIELLKKSIYPVHENIVKVSTWSWHFCVCIYFQPPDIVELGIDLKEFYKSVEWDILGVPASRYTFKIFI